MADKPEIPSPQDTAAAVVRRPRSRWWRAGGWSLILVSVFSLMLGGLALWGIGQTLTLPEWLRDRIETRIERNLGGMQITFGDVEMVVNRGWRPRVRLRDVALTDARGLPVVQLSDAEASLAMRPLLRGQLQAKSISLTGAFATLRRDAQGTLSLALGNNAATVNQAANLPRLIEKGDRLFLLPALAALVSVEMDALTLRYEDGLKNRVWTLDGGRVQLDRAGDELRLAAGFALLTGTDQVSTIEMNYASRIGANSADFGILVQDIEAADIAAQAVALAWMDVLRAPISGALRGSVDAEGALGPLSATLQIGAGVLQPTDATRPIPFEGARSYFTYRPAEQMIQFDEVYVASSWGTGLAEGRAYLGLGARGLDALIGQFNLSDMTINPDGLYETPLQVPGATADFRLELAPFRMTLGQLHVTQQDSQLHMSGALAADPDGWTLSLDGRTDNLTPERLLELWPERAVPKPRKWVDENLSGGSLRDIDLALRLYPGQKPNLYLDFDYLESTIVFLKTQPPISGASGQVSMVGGRFVATATAGQIVADMGGAVEVSGTSFIIPDVDVKPATPALVRVQGQGSVTSVLSLLNRPPLAVLKDTPLPVDMAQGQARVQGTVALPLKPRVQFEEFEFHLNGQIDGVQSDVLVPDHTVRADTLMLTGDQTQIVLAGSGSIDQLPVEVRWRQPIGRDTPKGSRLEGQVELSPRLVETFGIGLPNNSVSGRGTGRFTLDLAPGKPPTLTVTSDLKGVGLRLPPLGWSKPASAAGMLELNGVLGAQTRIDRLVLQAAGLSATGAVVNRPGGGLDRALLSSVRLHDWLDASVELVGRGRAAPDLRILSGTLDMRRATFDSGGGGGADAQPGGLQVSLSRLQVSDTIALTDFSGRFNLAGGLSGPFSGKVNGQTRVSGQLAPRGGRSAVQVQSNDAGGVIRAAGLLTKAHGGDFALTLLPSSRPGQFDGTLRITDTKVREAPAIAALLNAVSVVGLLDELSGQGIQFSEVDARFRLAPSKVTVFESSAIGPSIGLSMDGTMDLLSNRLRMQGVISPIYLLNQIGSVVGRKGEGMIGFNYTLTGPASSPRVQVNPLSALTPGPLRNIMRGARPPLDENAPSPRITLPNANSGNGSGR
ncbi:AsmA family protein [Sedimentitalea nanhaiensis]|uniref:AsmA domain-containing protein n=1 Tax=Sedimentitalea nanhaiensis TaxID=999627 RepID=A0A1I6ZJD8_9RHOB|nr:AsmA-like C-terminal region-containing protein [Sedimentitalea nanhaiensis]SFT62763.1 Protein of unknown function [Sedimentitalea nanhaiensis]